MKKSQLISIIIVSIIITFSSFSVYGHPGRTDSNGGHYDCSTGEYHYHHGYPAHQHPNGSCPYKSTMETSARNTFEEDSSQSYEEQLENGREMYEKYIVPILREKEAAGNSSIPWEPGAPFNAPETTNSFESSEESSNNIFSTNESLEEVENPEDTTTSSSVFNLNYIFPVIIFFFFLALIFIILIHRRERILKLQIELEKTKLEQLELTKFLQENSNGSTSSEEKENNMK
ncbi:ig-like domain-containing surface protein [Clostridium sp. CAG:149]|nr:ig-like domain-containing surface protein [Clostridium sp. CAG:149]